MATHADQQATTVAEPPVNVTGKAVEAVKAAMREENLEGHGLRIAVAGGGCSGFQYALSFEDEQREGDTIWERDGIKIYVDAMSAPYLQGAGVDYVTGLEGAGFKFTNPNAVRSCGCGSSFSA